MHARTSRADRAARSEIGVDNLLALAILKTNADRGGATYLDYFVPFVADALASADTDVVALEGLHSHLQKTVGLRLPLPVLRTIAKRAVRLGYAQVKDGIYYRNNERLATLDFGASRQRLLREQNELTAALAEFARALKTEWTSQEAEDRLLRFLRERSRDVIAAALTRDRAIDALAPGDEYVVQKFIVHCFESDQKLFGYVEDTAKGSMLADALYYPLDDVYRRPRGLDVYFDTTLIIRALGFSTQAGVDSARQVLDLAKQAGCNLRVFDHTEIEISGVLDSVARALQNPLAKRSAFGETLHHCVDAGVSATDVQAAMDSLPDRLRQLGITVQAAPKHESALGVDEQKLQAALREAIGYRRDEAMYKDVDSLTAVFRLRGGQLYSRIEDCPAIFVTTNSALAHSASSFFLAEYGNGSVSPVLLDHVFATVLWLKAPLNAPGLPRKLIVADCYAAMNPPDSLWRRYLDSLETLKARRVIGAEEYALLRYSPEARNVLLDLTKSDVSGFVEGTPLEVLAAAKQVMRADSERRLAEERRRRAEAEEERRTAEERVASVRELHVRRRQRASRAIAYALGTPILLGASVALALAVSMGVPRALPGSIFGVVAATALLAVQAGVSLWGQLLGGHLRQWGDSLFLSIAGGCERRIAEWEEPGNAVLSRETVPPPARYWAWIVASGPLTVMALLTAMTLGKTAAAQPRSEPADGPACVAPVETTDAHPVSTTAN